MAQTDLEDFCHRMGWKVIGNKSNKTHIVTYCPVHELNYGIESSHPKFYIDRRKGLCECKTKCGGSNLLRVIMQIHKCSVYDAYKMIVGSENAIGTQAGVMMAVLGRNLKEARSNREKNAEQEEIDELEVDNFAQIRYDMAHPHMSKSAYDYFMYPPGKKPTLITKETVNHFKISYRDSGFFKNRVIVPVSLRGQVTGYAAIDILGKDEWLKQNAPRLTEDDYDKIKYPKGFKSGANLFNYDDVEYGAEYIILTEGVRDAMKFWQLGYKNVVSIFGVNLTQEHMELLSVKYPDKIIVAMDGDIPGIAAATKIGSKLFKSFNAALAFPPLEYYGSDPKTLPEPAVEMMMSNLQEVKK